MAKMRLRKGDRIAEAGEGNRQAIYIYIGTRKRLDKIFPTTIMKKGG